MQSPERESARVESNGHSPDARPVDSRKTNADNSIGSGRASGQKPVSADTEGPWYRLADMCRLFDVGERCIWTWVSKGKLPQPCREGRRWTRWPREEIDELLRRWGRKRTAG